MSRVRGSIDIARTVEDVFEVVADPRNEVRYNPGMTESVKITDGPIGVGTTFRSTVLIRGRPVEVRTECTGLDRPHRFATRNVMAGAVAEGEVRCGPIPGGTSFSWEWQMSVSGPARIAGPLIALIGRHRERRIWTGLKRMLEDGRP
ncbi:SRPBCC family protein [Kribbella sp. NPDC020789]